MCLFTHFAAGALAGGATGNVWLGAAAGFASHAVLDVIPHYDHPDWRLELGGGVLALLILAAMPFASWPAVVGGLFGMVPDLENLFQKLGRMRRDQFLYPTHTGLLRHGRALGPRSLVWQVAIFVACFGALGLVSPGEASAAEPAPAVMGEPVVRVLAQSADRTVLRVDFPAVRQPADWQAVAPLAVEWPRPLRHLEADPAAGLPERMVPPLLGLGLAVPTREALSWQVTDVQWWRAPAGGDDADLVRVSRPNVARMVPLAGVELELAPRGGILRGLTVEVGHPASAAGRRQLALARDKTADDLPAVRMPAGIRNPDLYRALARGARLAARQDAAVLSAKAAADDLFDRSDNWLKLFLDETGVYRVTGQQLSGYGVATTQVDPAKLRLYRGGGLPLETNPEIPDSLQAERSGLTEVAIEVRDGGDGEWNLDDEFRFYGVATSTWKDRFDPAAEPDEHYDHPYADQAVYWLTWAGDATADPMAGQPRRVAQVQATPTGGERVDTARLRLHAEKQDIEAAGEVWDGWLWDSAVQFSRTETFDLRPPVAGSAARYQVEIRGMYRDTRTFSDSFGGTVHLNGDTGQATSLVLSKYAQDDSLRVRIMGESDAVQAGANTITLTNTAPTPRRLLGFDSFDVFYWSALDLGAGAGQLEFAHWGDQVAAPGTAVDFVVTSASAAAPVVWDVTDPAAPAVWAGTAGAGDAFTYGAVRDPDTALHLVAGAATDLRAPLRGERVDPLNLRALPTDLDYVVVTASAFLSAAQRLADFRDGLLPGVASPAAAAVRVETIYDNFSGGQKDPLAIRNYLRWLYQAGGGRLAQVCLLGNASRDFRNYKDRVLLSELADLVPTELRTDFPLWPTYQTLSEPYPTDDGLVSFDAHPVGDLDLPDLAVGRLPAVTVAEASAMVDRIIAYENDGATGPWANRIALVSDDVVSPDSYPDPDPFEVRHITEAERVAKNYVPFSLDLLKLYGAGYDFPPGSRVKLGLRNDINAALARGTTMFYYVGHGAEDNLADEQIFDSRNIPSLGNGSKRFVFAAFSCDVGIYDSPFTRSMAEEFVRYDNGGAIASICASQVSYSTQNDALTNRFFEAFYPGRAVDPTTTLGGSLFQAKLGLADFVLPSYRKNGARYNLLGDPAQRLPNARDELQFAAGTPDTIRAGALHTVRLDGGKTLAGAGDGYSLLAQEASRDVEYRTSATGTRTYVEPGASIFLGSGIMPGDDLAVSFKVPLQLNFGDDARLRLIVHEPDADRAAVAVIPSVPGAIGAVDDVTGPAIALAFTDNRYRVRTGDELVAVLSDTSGIAMLGTSPVNSLLLEMDESGFRANVTSSFTYDADSYTSGRLVFPLPADVALGRHKAALFARDALGNLAADTLSFEVVAEGSADIHAVTLFPNPTPGNCRLLFELSDPMAVRWDIYSLAGSRLRSIAAEFGAGPQILEWDGRDQRGDEIANGTYLYVLRGDGATADDRQIRKTGKLVIMR